MNCYQENTCRICKKVFCCKNCREQHETLIHEINVDCNICLYGRTLLIDPPQYMINHIKNYHWPLHCIFCKRFFESISELLKQNKCIIQYKSGYFEKSPSPVIINSGGENKFESPPYFSKGKYQSARNISMFTNLATSTPLQREEINNAIEKNNEAITPVDFSDIDKEKKCNDCLSLKRNVTFCETPMSTTCKKENNDKLDTGAKFEDQIPITPNSGTSSATFYSAKQVQDNSTPHQIEKNQITNMFTNNNINVGIENSSKGKENLIPGHENTLWISASNMSPPDFTQPNEPLIQINYTTPLVAKIKRRQVNVVAPTAVTKKSVELELQQTNIIDLNTSYNFQSEDRFPSVVVELRSEGTDELPEKVSSANIRETSEVLSKQSVNGPGRLWTSVSRLVKNVTNAVQGVSTVTYHSKTSLKRSSLEYDTFDGPSVKRYKLTEIKCRRPIRMSLMAHSLEHKVKNSITLEIKKTFLDKSTQTDD